MHQRMRHQCVLIAAAALMFFTNLGVPRLWDDDEAIFAQTAREMIDRGDWVVPYFNGHLFPDKPPLLYWMMMAAYQIFGTTELAARLPSALCSVVCVLATYQLGRKLFAPAVGLWAGLILASSLNFAVIARAATPDALLALFCTLAILALVSTTAGGAEGENSNERPAPWLSGQAALAPAGRTYLLAYGAMAMAVLAKGPIGLVLPGAVIALALVCINAPKPAALPESEARNTATSGGARWLRMLHGVISSLWRIFNPRRLAHTIWSMRPVSALAIVAIIAGPWYLWVSVRSDGRWTEQFFGVHNFGRFLHAMENHRGPIFYYLPAVLVGLFPWSVLAIPTFLQLVRRIRHDHPWRAGTILIACWAAVWIGFFSLSATKLPSYIVPAYPALALMAACLIHAWATQTESLDRRWLRAAFGILAFVGLAIILVVPVVAKVYLAKDLLLGLFGLAPLVGGAAALLLSERGRPAGSAAALAITAVVFITALFGFAAPRVDRFQNSQMFADLIRQSSATEHAYVAQYDYARPSVVFYAQQHVVACRTPEQVGEFFREHAADAFLLTPEDRLSQLSAMLPPGVSVLERSPSFLRRDKQVVLLGRTSVADAASASRGSQAQAPRDEQQWHAKRR